MVFLGEQFSKRGKKIVVLCDLVEAQGEYIKLLEKELSSATIFMSIRAGYTPDLQVYAEGCLRRGDIETFYEEHRELGGVRFNHIEEMKVR